MVLGSNPSQVEGFFKCDLCTLHVASLFTFGLADVLALIRLCGHLEDKLLLETYLTVFLQNLGTRFYCFGPCTLPF